MGPAFSSPSRPTRGSQGPVDPRPNGLKLRSESWTREAAARPGTMPDSTAEASHVRRASRSLCGKVTVRLSAHNTLRNRGGRPRGGERVSAACRPENRCSKDMDEEIGGPKVGRD